MRYPIDLWLSFDLLRIIFHSIGPRLSMSTVSLNLGLPPTRFWLHPKALLECPIPSQRQNLTEGIIRSVPKGVRREKSSKAFSIVPRWAKAKPEHFFAPVGSGGQGYWTMISVFQAADTQSSQLPYWQIGPAFRKRKVDFVLCATCMFLEMRLDHCFAFGLRRLMDALVAILKLASPEVAWALGLIRRDIAHNHLHLDGFARWVI